MNLDYTEENVNSVTILPSPGVEYTVKSKKVYRPFGMAAPFRHKKSRSFSMDLIDKLVTVSKAAAVLFNDLKNNRCPDTNVVTMGDWGELTPSEIRSAYRKISELKKADLIVGVEAVDGKINKPPKFTYMINPYYIKPWEYDKAKTGWELLGGKVI